MRAKRAPAFSPHCGLLCNFFALNSNTKNGNQNQFCGLRPRFLFPPALPVWPLAAPLSSRRHEFTAGSEVAAHSNLFQARLPRSRSSPKSSKSSTMGDSSFAFIDLCINNVIDQHKKEGRSDCPIQPRSFAGDVRMAINRANDILHQFIYIIRTAIG